MSMEVIENELSETERSIDQNKKQGGGVFVQDKKQGTVSIVQDRKQETVVDSKNAEITWWSTAEAMTISSIVLAFGLIVCVMAVHLLKLGKSADGVLKVLGSILVIIASLFLVVAGYNPDQIAPVIGLLATIAGYLLGKQDNARVLVQPVHAGASDPVDDDALEDRGK